MMALDPEFKARWVAALRSGRYKRGACGLRSLDDRFCPIGVACDLINPHGWRRATSEACKLYIFEATAVGRLGSAIVMLDRTREDIGLDVGDMQKVLARNDAHGYTFPQMADWIERNL